MSEIITYELPLNERVRTFLRLEDLFFQMEHFAQQDAPYQNRAELGCLLDILSIAGRSDLRNEITKEIERHIKRLVIFTQNPHVDRKKLQESISQLTLLNQKLIAFEGRIDQQASNIQLLKSLAQRSSIPGGTCDFDLPSYHFWLNQPVEIRRQQIHDWSENLHPIKESIALLLQFIRFSSAPIIKTAISGFYQQALNSSQAVQLLRVSVATSVFAFAEISGGKHRFSVRFMQPSETERASQVTGNIDFTLHICQL